MSRIQIVAGLLAFCLTAGCKAQTAPSGSAAQSSPDAALMNRRIEVMVRSQFNVPQDYTVAIGARTPSKIPGYDSLPVTLSRKEKTTTVDFLLSTDGKTLARLETFDLDKDPVFTIDVAGRPIRGNPAAKVTVINFDDLECGGGRTEEGEHKQQQDPIRRFWLRQNDKLLSLEHDEPIE